MVSMRTKQLNVFTTSETAGEVGPVKLVKAPRNSLLTVPMRYFCCGYLLPVLCLRVLAHYTLCMFKLFLVRLGLVRGRLCFWKELLNRLTMCSLCIFTIRILGISRFGFEVWIWVLIATFPGHNTRDLADAGSGVPGRKKLSSDAWFCHRVKIKFNTFYMCSSCLFFTQYKLPYYSHNNPGTAPLYRL